MLSKESNKNEINLTASSKILKSKIFENNLVETSIGSPKLNWNEIPLAQDLDTKNLNIKLISKDNQEFFGGIAVNVGNPHVIFFVEDLDNFNLEEIGPKIENDILFPQKCNVTIAKNINKNLIKIKVWERGAGLTKACGTAACATAVASYKKKLSENNVNIKFKEGILNIKLDAEENIFMTGPVSDIKNIKIEI